MHVGRTKQLYFKIESVPFPKIASKFSSGLWSPEIMKALLSHDVLLSVRSPEVGYARRWALKLVNDVRGRCDSAYM